MNNRTKVLLGAGAVFLSVAYFVLPRAIEKLMRPPISSLLLRQPSEFGPREGNDKLAPVALEGLGDLGDDFLVRIGPWYHPARRNDWFALNLRINGGRAFVHGKLVPLGQLPTFINEVQKTGANWVIVTPAKGSASRDIVSVVNACRRSQAYVIYVNLDES